MQELQYKGAEHKCMPHFWEFLCVKSNILKPEIIYLYFPIMHYYFVLGLPLKLKWYDYTCNALCM